MAADAWKKYNSFPEALGDGTIDLDTHTIKVALFLSTSNCADATKEQYSALDNEVANGFGYTTGGATVAVTWSHATSTTTLDTADATWTATGGAITARFAVMYDDTPATKPVIAWTLLDNTPADVTANDGNNFVIQMNAAGIFTITGMA